MKIKKIDDIKSLEEATEKEMLTYILATQLQILRRLDFLDNERKKISHFDATKEMITKVDSFTSRINEYLSADDEAKGRLKF